MDALEIPRLRGVSHAYAFWGALVAAVTLIVITPGRRAAGRGGDLRRRAVRAVRRLRPLPPLALASALAADPAAHRPLDDLRLHRRLLHAGRHARAVGHDPWVVLITVWAGALGGVALSVAWITAPRALCAACYVALGWVAVLAFPQLHAALPVAPLVLIASGGVLYTAGAVIFALGPPEPVAAGVRLPRDLPRVRDPGRAWRTSSPWPAGSSCRPDRDYFADGVMPWHRSPAPASGRAAARRAPAPATRLRPALRRGVLAAPRASARWCRPASRSRSRRACAGSCCRAPGWRSSTGSRASTRPGWSTRTTAASCG